MSPAGSVAIIGAGAIGGSLGGLLAVAGHDVTLIGRPEQVAALRGGELRIDGCVGSLGCRVSASARLAFRPDLALLTVKAHDAASAALAHREALCGTTVVACQNGLRGEEVVAEVLPGSTVLSAVMAVSACYSAPGRVTLAHAGGMLVGRVHGPVDERAHRAARVLDDALRTRVSSRVLGALWLKLVLNLNNALSAITGLSMGEVYADRYLGELGVRMMREGLLVARRTGVRLEALPDVPAAVAAVLGRLPAGAARRVLLQSAARLTSWPVFTSTLQSIWRGRPTEIDYLNGEIVRRARAAGVPAPLNERAVTLVRQVERSARFLSTAEVRSGVN